MRSARAVLWDMDGTLIDSEEFHWISWRNTMANEGIAITHEQFLASSGQRNDSIIPRWPGAGKTGAVPRNWLAHDVGRLFGREGCLERLGAEGGRRFAGEETQDEKEDSEDEADTEIEIIARLRDGEPERRENQKRQAEAQEETAFHGCSSGEPS
jgi:beta-phosphoglucomutase-like phosphatase (HAD superfamily)